MSSRDVELPSGGRVLLLEKGAGPPLVLLHGSGVAVGFVLPLLEELEGARALAPAAGVGTERRNRPAATPLSRDRRRLARPSARRARAGHHRAARPLGGRDAGSAVRAGSPGSSRAARADWPAGLAGYPLPYRLMVTPGVRDLLARVPPSPKSVLQFARFMGERETLSARPDLVDLFLVAGRDPLAVSALRAEVRTLLSSFALLLRSGWRRRPRVRPDELGKLAVPTLLICGEREPLGSVAVARAVSELIPGARLQVLPDEHGPWLGHPAQTAAAVVDFVRGDHGDGFSGAAPA